MLVATSPATTRWLSSPKNMRPQTKKTRIATSARAVQMTRRPKANRRDRSWCCSSRRSLWKSYCRLSWASSLSSAYWCSAMLTVWRSWRNRSTSRTRSMIWAVRAAGSTSGAAGPAPPGSVGISSAFSSDTERPSYRELTDPDSGRKHLGGGLGNLHPGAGRVGTTGRHTPRTGIPQRGSRSLPELGRPGAGRPRRALPPTKKNGSRLLSRPPGQPAASRQIRNRPESSFFLQQTAY